MGQLKPWSALKAINLVHFLILALLSSANQNPQASAPSSSSSTYWVANIQRQGTVAFGSNSSYTIYRNVMDYGATGKLRKPWSVLQTNTCKGNGDTDDTDAINNAISDGNRCGDGCDSSTTTPAIVYFPPGTYLVSAPIIQYYYTQLIGDAIDVPTIKAAEAFTGIAMIDSDPYLPGGANWYTNQNNFYRQIRNFVIDMTLMPISQGAGIHWQVAQATSLQNIVFNMQQGGGTENKQQGIFMDNGSGGFMTDLVFNGGNYGAFFGNQQFTSRNLTFNNCQTAIFMNWNWLWTLKSVNINNCGVGIDMSAVAAPSSNQSVGSIILLDSTISNTPVGIRTDFNATSQLPTGGTLYMQNVDCSQNVQIAVAAADGSQILAGNSVIGAWAQGNAYQPTYGSQRLKRAPQAASSSTTSCTTTATPITSPAPFANATSPTNMTSVPATLLSNATATASTCTATMVPVSSTRIQQQLTQPTMPSALLSNGKIFERSKPQYETVPASSFVSVKSNGAVGDGNADDTQAIQNVFNSVTAGEIVYFDHGAYRITQTVKVPPNITITGEIWPLIMADGASFNDSSSPQPVFQVGNPGDTGAVEMSDLIFETLGPAPGAILLEWNVQETSQGSCGLWDVHFRIGGTAGTHLQQNTCQGNVTGSFEFNPDCAGAYLMFHIAQSSTVYVENMWLWVADHELDIAQHDQTNIYNGRGMLIESQGPSWLYGTSVEHSQLYNYQVLNAQNLFMGAIQTETPYMQSMPNALDGGFTPNPVYGDPDFANCTDDSCVKSWGLRVVDSQDIYTYGAGLYMVDIECSTGIYLYGLNTVGTTNMVTVNGQNAALESDNVNWFAQTIAIFNQQAGNFNQPVA